VLLAPDSVVIGEKVFRKRCEESPRPPGREGDAGPERPAPVAAQMMIRMALMSR
jgi:hypothetical protein